MNGGYVIIDLTKYGVKANEMKEIVSTTLFNEILLKVNTNKLILVNIIKSDDEQVESETITKYNTVIPVNIKRTKKVNEDKITINSINTIDVFVSVDIKKN